MKHLLKRLIVLLSFYTSLLADCSSYIDDFYINEVQTWDSWVEIYAKNPEAVSNWSVKGCSLEGNGNNLTEVCETVPFSYDPAIDGYFIIADFTAIEFHSSLADFVLYDDSGAVVDYFRVGRDVDSYPLQISEATACGLDTTCNIFEQKSQGQRDFSRKPDGSCTWVELTGRWSGTPDRSNDGGVPPYVPLNYQFDAWDTFRNINDRNISTKISAQGFDLTLAALNETNDAYQDINATVCVQVIDLEDGNAAESAWVRTVFQNQSTATVSFTVPTAVRNSTVNIVWKKDVVETCPLVSASGMTLTSDNFAIRPDTFNCDTLAPSVLISEHPYPSTFVANPFNDALSATQGYTTSSVVLSANTYMRTGDLNTSLNGVMTPSTLSFVNGTSNNIDVSFNDVGDIGVDLNDSTWANVDIDDTLEADRVIHAECRRIFRPDHFLVQVTRPILENNSTGFTYLSNLTPSVSMSAWVRDLNMTITAQGEANGTMRNYSAPNNTLYANDVTLSPVLSLPVKHSAATKLVDLVSEDSAAITGFSFVDGVSVHSYNDVRFNYNRSFNTPTNPFRVDGDETYFSLNVQDNTYATVIGDDNTSSDANATFYYGRLNPSDIAGTLLPVRNPVAIEVYDDSNSLFTSGMNQSSLFWYTNDMHSGDAAGNTYEAVPSSNTLIDNALVGFAFTYNPVVNGIEDLDITAASENKAIMHLKTQEWLWYVPSGFGSAYDDTAGTDCTMHPCFKFSFLPNNSVLKIESGDFNGTVIPDVNRSDYIQKGIKLFR